MTKQYRYYIWKDLKTGRLHIASNIKLLRKELEFLNVKASKKHMSLRFERVGEISNNDITFVKMYI